MTRLAVLRPSAAVPVPADHGLPDLLQPYLESIQILDRLHRLMLDLIKDEFERLRRDYRALRQREWAGQGRYDAWIESPLNNAKLLPFGLYDQWVPAFAALFAREERDWRAFYAAVAALGRLPQADRRAALESLMQDD